MYGLDKLRGEAITPEVLSELKQHGVVGKSEVLEELKLKISEAT